MAGPDALETTDFPFVGGGCVRVAENGRVMLANRWRLPVESVRWMESCLDTGGVPGEGEFGRSPCRGQHARSVIVTVQPTPVGVPGELYTFRDCRKRSHNGMEQSSRVEDPRLGSLLKTGDLGPCTP